MMSSSSSSWLVLLSITTYHILVLMMISCHMTTFISTILVMASSTTESSKSSRTRILLSSSTMRTTTSSASTRTAWINHHHSNQVQKKLQQSQYGKVILGTNRKNRNHRIRLHTISNLFNNNNNNNKDSTTMSTTTTLPRDVKESIKILRESIQLGLQNRISRMTIDFPLGTSFQLEKDNNTKKKKLPQDITMNDLDKSHRELSKLIVEMFHQPIGGNNIAVIFPLSSSADNAKQIWNIGGNQYCNILSIDRRKDMNNAKGNNNKNKPKAKGFASKLALELDEDTTTDTTTNIFELPNNIEVAIFVSPSSKEIPTIERISKNVGMGTLIIILNMNQINQNNGINYGSIATKEYFINEYKTIFYLSPISLSLLSDNENENAISSSISNNKVLFMYHTYVRKEEWIVSTPPSKTSTLNIIRPPQTILSTDHIPSIEECYNAYNDKIQKDGGEDNNNNSNQIIQSFTEWFR